MTDRNREAGDRPVLMYLCYGAQEIYDQAIFSILSLLHVAGGSSESWRIVVYCDNPDAVAALPVETVRLDAATLDRWLGDSDYIHRRKTCAILDALDRFGGRVAFIDTDTWFRRPPEPLFARIAPGRVCFHLCEGYLLSTGTPSDKALARQLESGTVHAPDSGAVVGVTARTRMWNTGVVGVHAADRDRVCRARDLADAIWAGADPAGAYGRKIHHAEQFAMGWAFADARLAEAADIVHHYWPAASKARFASHLPDLVRETLADPSPTALARAYALRPREGGADAAKDRVKMRVRQAALALGLPVRGVRRSVA